MDRLRCAHCGEVIGVYEHPPDNHLILISRQAQLALLTDLLLHSNLFFLVFEDGETGKVKLGLLDHETVETVACAPDNRLRISCYLARHFEQEWDFQNDTAINVTPGASKSKPGAELRALAVVRAAIKRRNRQSGSPDGR